MAKQPERNRIGRVVTLASGGPLMTIVSVTTVDPHLVWCAWFDGVELKSSTFPVEALH